MPIQRPVVGVCIFCSDPAVGLWKRIKDRLILPEEMFGKVGVFGGPIALANQEALPEAFHFLMSQLHFAKGTFPSISRIMLVGHNCRFYKEVPQKQAATISEKKDDLARGAIFLKKRFSNMAITVFFAEDDSDGFIQVPF